MELDETSTVKIAQAADAEPTETMNETVEINDQGKRKRDETKADSSEQTNMSEAKRRKIQTSAVSANCQYYFWHAQRKHSLAHRNEDGQSIEEIGMSLLPLPEGETR